MNAISIAPVGAMTQVGMGRRLVTAARFKNRVAPLLVGLVLPLALRVGKVSLKVSTVVASTAELLKRVTVGKISMVKIAARAVVSHSIGVLTLVPILWRLAIPRTPALRPW